MATHYQYARPDGHPDWTLGQEDFQAVWDNASDSLRFHKGKGFVIVVKGKEGPKRRLWEMDKFLKSQLEEAKLDEPIRVRAEEDGYAILFRRHEVAASKAEQLIAAIARREGLPYVFGGRDCSGLIQECVRAVTGLELVHNADAMRSDPRFKTITAGEAKMGDFIFVDRDSRGVEHHVATILDRSSDRYPGGLVVWDTQPHSTTSPARWPQPYLGTGVRVRPAFKPWYCGDISSYARLGVINGG